MTYLCHNSRWLLQLQLGVTTALLQFELASRLSGFKPINCVDINGRAIVDIDMDSKWVLREMDIVTLS